MHTFGYRPDLSRRSPESRLNSRGHRRPPADCVALDIMGSRDELSREEPLSYYTQTALSHFTLFAYAFSTSLPMTEQLLITSAYVSDRFTSQLTYSTLKSFYHTAYERWRGDEAWTAALMVSCTRNNHIQYTVTLSH